MRGEPKRQGSAADPGESAEPAIARLTRVLRDAELDCACRENLFRAIESLERPETRRRQRRALDAAFALRRDILGLLLFLDDLDRIVDPAFDASVCAEMARVFEDIAEAATQGAVSLRRLSETGPG